MKIKKGDMVVILAGKDRAKEGKVLRVFPKRNQVLVEGIHVVVKHQKTRKRGSQGQIIHRPLPIPSSAVALRDPKTKKPARVGYIFEGTGNMRKKVRVVRPSGTQI